MEFILIGQPNCGKSTIFNEVAGYKAISSNYPGVSVQYTKSVIDFQNQKIDITDLPGAYSANTTDEAELVSVKYIRHSPSDSVIINVIDASVLSRSLDLTLQLLSLRRPMVIALNMMDEAARKGIKIDSGALSEKLGVPVVETVGRKGRGVYQLFEKAFQVAEGGYLPNYIYFDRPIENILDEFASFLKKSGVPEKWNYRFLALKILEKDRLMKKFFDEYLGENQWRYVAAKIKEFEKLMENFSEMVVSSARHSLAFRIFESVAAVSSNKFVDFRQKLDDIFMHPFIGYIIMGGVLYLIFTLIFTIGNLVEPIFLDNFDLLNKFLSDTFGENSILFHLLNGLVSGIGGGIGIVIPYLLPFFIFLSILEDTGYLARIAYLIDNLMHKIGLHGLSILPIILGYGCTVPGILATRILKSTRDKIITATLTTLVPCSARMTIIFGLVGFFISMEAAVAIYILNIIILGITGKIMSKIMPDVSPGLILEIPKYHLPSPKAVMSKTWFRLKEFIIVAWPLLIIGSVLLEFINYYDLADSINSFLAVFTTGILGLPSLVGVTLLFGIMRKELSLILLFSAMGTNDVLSVMTFSQVLGFTVFVTFYIPCLATIAALKREFNLKISIGIAILTFLIAIFLTLLIRIFIPF